MYCHSFHALLVVLAVAGQSAAAVHGRRAVYGKHAGHGRARCRPTQSLAESQTVHNDLDATASVASGFIAATPSVTVSANSAETDVVSSYTVHSSSAVTLSTHASQSSVQSTFTPYVVTTTRALGTTTSSSTAAATTSGSSSSSTSSLTPNGIKAGIAGGDAFSYMKDHIGWWYDWSPNPSKSGSPIGVPMLWGGGQADAQDASRLAQFKTISTTPKYVLGYEEPDCASGSGSAGMTVDAGVTEWETLIAPWADKGTLLGSPSMCKQADETWLAEFSTKISTRWDFTAIHVNKNSMDGVRKDIDHYWNKYGKPIWVTEFACVDDYETFTPCTDQSEINSYINEIVDLMEADSRVFAYAYSNGLGLGDVWPLMDGSSLSDSGKTYLAAISKYH